MVVRLPICILTDLTLPLPVYSPHNFAPVPPVPPTPPPALAVPMSPAPACAMDPVATMLWPPGNALFLNKYSITVTHNKRGIIQAGHDLGVLIPHVQIAPAPNNFFGPIQTLFSSRKVMFNSSSVKADGVFVGFAGLIGMMPAPMMVCGDPLSFPMGEVPTRWLNNVWAGMSAVNLLLGVMNIGVKLAMEKVAIPKTRLGPLKKLVKEQRGGRGSLIYKKMFPIQSLKAAKTALTKQLIGFVTGAITIGLQKEGGISLALGSSFASVSVGVTHSVGSGVTTASVKTQTIGQNETVSGSSKDGVGATAAASWGGGGATVSMKGSGTRIRTHNLVDGTVSDETVKP